MYVYKCDVRTYVNEMICLKRKTVKEISDELARRHTGTVYQRYSLFSVTRAI